MALTLTGITPDIAAPGDLIVLTGTGFAAGLVVSFVSEHRILDDKSPAISSGNSLTTSVPDILAGEPGTIIVALAMPGGEETAPLDLELLELPAVEQVRPLCSKSATKRFMGVAPTETFDDSRLDALILMASTQVVSECRRTFGLQSYTESYDGDGTPLLELLHGPVVSVTALIIDGTVQPIEELSIGPSWIRFDEIGEYQPRIRATQRLFAHGVRNVVVSYRAGYALIPADVSQATMLQVAYLLNTANKQGLVNEGNQTAGVSTIFSQQPLCPAAKAICNRYKRAKVGVVG